MKNTLNKQDAISFSILGVGAYFAYKAAGSGRVQIAVLTLVVAYLANREMSGRPHLREYIL